MRVHVSSVCVMARLGCSSAISLLPHASDFVLAFASSSGTPFRGVSLTIPSGRERANLTNGQIEMLIEYFEDWDQLRLCCGAQASTSWKCVLLSRNGTEGPEARASVKHRCARVDVSAAEQRLKRSRIMRQGLVAPHFCTGHSCQQFERDMQRLVLPPGQAVRLVSQVSGLELLQELRRQGLSHQFCT